MSAAPKLFDLSKPDAETIPSSFGGGWIIPLTPAGSQALSEFFGEEPSELAPLGGRAGYIVEPYECAMLAEHLKGAGIEWELG